MRSVVVVLPASMCAMIPMLRVLSSATVRAMFFSFSVVPGRKKALAGPGAAWRRRPALSYFLRASIAVSSPLDAALQTA
jgi:hypothetical protein